MASDFLTLMLDHRVPMKFRLIPPGEFRMGSRGFSPHEEPIHRVRITQPFYMGVYPVTQLQWQTIVDTVPLLNGQADSTDRGKRMRSTPSKFKGDRRPVEQVSWYDVRRWCQLLHRSSAVSEAVDSQGKSIDIADVDLPTEAQWEYACRAGTDTEYSTGDGAAALDAAGWHGGKSGNETHDVGEKASNAFGLYDMHGNVDEWCRDTWCEHAYKERLEGVQDPFRGHGVNTSEEHSGRVLRGGSWYFSAVDCRAAYRFGESPSFSLWNLGFRVGLF